MSNELSSGPPADPAFAEVLALITAARQRAYQAVNTALIDLYWQIGGHISRKIASAEWGDGVVDSLARHIAASQPGLRGFTRSNLLRMRQFYQTYRDHEFFSPVPQQLDGAGDAGQAENVVALLRQLPWTHHLLIMGQAKRPEEREFYLRLAIREKWSSRELERQMKGALFERTVLSPPKVSALLTQIHPEAELGFYLEALDRDVRKAHENPALGVLLCASKDEEVVEYALTPTLIAEYQTQLPDKKLLRQKLHEFYLHSAPEGGTP